MNACDLKRRGFVETAPGQWSKAADTRPNSPRSGPKLEPDTQGQPEKKTEDQGWPEGRFLISYRIYRKRRLDLENLATKTITDCLITHGIIPDDGPDIVPEIQIEQFKSSRERVEIEVYEMNQKDQEAEDLRQKGVEISRRFHAGEITLDEFKSLSSAWLAEIEGASIETPQPV
ncbi:MAG: RusA family crossover junction endodeoxyribonuclease [Verrucomicrobiota bacterium]